MADLSKASVAAAINTPKPAAKPTGFINRVTGLKKRVQDAPNAREAYLDYVADKQSGGEDALPFDEWRAQQS